jgi:UDP-N-acetyl-D-glucosamine/UDP-N-acetyl-D-galactosamine dehydrogenase
MIKNLRDSKIAIIGLGYVGLPLAVEFAKKFVTVGFDINSKRVAELKQGKDATLEVEDSILQSVSVDDLDSGKGLFSTTDSSLRFLLLRTNTIDRY